MNNSTQHRSWIFGICGRVGGAALALTILLGLAVVAAPSAQAQNFTTFDAPGAGTGAYQGTVPTSINTAGAIAGAYMDASGLAHGFVRAANGTISTFDVTGALNTFPVSINTAGVITGGYDHNTGSHGFVRGVKGTIATFDVPGANGTAPSSINAAGDITGFYKDASYVHHGFVRAVNGTITYPIDAPGAGTGAREGTRPISINTAGEIAGAYMDASLMWHGFVRTVNGAITTFDAPGAGGGTGTLLGYLGTIPFSIDKAGAIAGTYTDASGARHGFVRAANGTMATFDAPGAVTGAGVIQGTGGSSINTAGVITGSYADASALLHGFVRAANGTITTFSAPGAAPGPDLVQGTVGLSINAAGAVTGAYTDASGVAHGFLLAPVTATTTTLTSSPNPSTYGQAVIFTAAVTSKLGAPPDGETVSFMKGKTVLGTGMLSGGSATFTTSTLKVGTTSVTAVYGGDSNFAGSTSKAVKQVVEKAGE